MAEPQKSLDERMGVVEVSLDNLGNTVRDMGRKLETQMAGISTTLNETNVRRAGQSQINWGLWTPIIIALFALVGLYVRTATEPVRLYSQSTREWVDRFAAELTKHADSEGHPKLQARLATLEADTSGSLTEIETQFRAFAARQDQREERDTEIERMTHSKIDENTDNVSHLMHEINAFRSSAQERLRAMEGAGGITTKIRAEDVEE